MKFLKVFLIVLLSNLLLAEYPKRILFVGNSYLYYNDSVHNHVERMLIEHYEDEDIIENEDVGDIIEDNSTTNLKAQKFAYVDTDYILNKIPDFKQAQDKLDLVSANWQSEIEAKYSEVDKMYRAYQQEQVLLIYFLLRL